MKLIITILTLILPVIGIADDDCTFKVAADDTLKKATSAFHDIMAPLWHGPVRDGDVSGVKAEIKGLVDAKTAVMNAHLPEAKKAKCAVFSKAAAAFSESVDSLHKLIDNKGSDEEIKEAFSEMHTRYGKMVRSLLDLADYAEKFHEVMAPLWHESWEEKDVQAIKDGTGRLFSLAKAMKKAAKNPEHKALVDLYTAVEELDKLCKGTDDQAILDGLEKVHEAYHAFSDAFEIEEHPH